MTTGIRKRGDSYEAAVYLVREAKKVRKTFPTLAAAKSWRTEAQVAAGRGALRSAKPTTIHEAWGAWHLDAKAGAIRSASGHLYKPGTLRAYEKSMRLRVLPEFGAAKLVDVQRPDLQRFVHELQAGGLGGSTIRTTIAAVRAIYRHSLDQGDLAVNPCNALKLPQPATPEIRVADPVEAAALIAALPRDRALWATALYAGLRRGELQALRVSDIGLATGVVRVERGWDEVEGEQVTKGRTQRQVPVVADLRDYLVEHRMESGREGSDLVFGRTPSEPFNPKAVTKRADRAWREAGLERIVLHDCRHTFVSLMAAAGVDPGAVSEFAGHKDVAFTLNRYQHLFKGSGAQAAEMLDAYLTAQRARAADEVRAVTGAFTGASQRETA